MTRLAFTIQTIPKIAKRPNAIGKDKAFEIKPMMTGPNKKPPIANVFMTASPEPFGILGTLAALAYKIGAPHETPAPTIEKPRIAVKVLGKRMTIPMPVMAMMAPKNKTLFGP